MLSAKKSSDNNFLTTVGYKGRDIFVNLQAKKVCRIMNMSFGARTLILVMSFLPLGLFAQESGGDMQLLRSWVAASVVSEESVELYSLDSCFLSIPVPQGVQARMRGKSYKEGCEVPMESLRYLRLLHRNREGKVQLGEMVCNKSIASRLVSIFRSLYLQGYRIERMVLLPYLMNCII